MTMHLWTRRTASLTFIMWESEQTRPVTPHGRVELQRTSRRERDSTAARKEIRLGIGSLLARAPLSPNFFSFLPFGLSIDRLRCRDPILIIVAIVGQAKVRFTVPRVGDRVTSIRSSLQVAFAVRVQNAATAQKPTVETASEPLVRRRMCVARFVRRPPLQPSL